MATTSFTPVSYSSLVTEPNTFGRPRQKIWGVFIIASYATSVGKLHALNFTSKEDITPIFPTSSKNAYLDNHSTKTDFTRMFMESQLKSIDYKYDFTPPAIGPKGEEIKKTSAYNGDVHVIKDGATMIREGTYPGEDYGFPVYRASDAVYTGEVNFYYYNEVVETISWDLVLLTKDINEAKDKLNDWLRKPDTSGSPARPKIGIDSVIICEVVPADTIIEL